MDGNEVISLFCQTIEADLDPVMPVGNVFYLDRRRQTLFAVVGTCLDAATEFPAHLFGFSISSEEF